MMNCKIFGSKLAKETWTKKKDGWVRDIRYPAGTYEYYNCLSCGMRYTPQEVEAKSREIDAV